MGGSNILGKRIEQIRKDRGETQQQLADAVGVKRETVNQWESGTRQLKAEAVVSIAKHYCITSDYLLGLAESSAADPEMRAVCEYTGLSEEAVLWLASNKHRKDISTVVSYLLSHRGFIQRLSSFLWGFAIDEISNTKYRSIPILKPKMQPEYMYDILFSSVVRSLVPLRDKFQDDMGSDADAISKVVFLYIKRNADYELCRSVISQTEYDDNFLWPRPAYEYLSSPIDIDTETALPEDIDNDLQQEFDDSFNDYAKTIHEFLVEALGGKGENLNGEHKEN